MKRGWLSVCRVASLRAHGGSQVGAKPESRSCFLLFMVAGSPCWWQLCCHRRKCLEYQEVTANVLKPCLFLKMRPSWDAGMQAARAELLTCYDLVDIGSFRQPGELIGECFGRHSIRRHINLEHAPLSIS